MEIALLQSLCPAQSQSSTWHQGYRQRPEESEVCVQSLEMARRRALGQERTEDKMEAAVQAPT